MRERTREELELENVELRERVEWLEAQVAAMLASPKYDTLGSEPPARREPEDPVVAPPSTGAWLELPGVKSKAKAKADQLPMQTAANPIFPVAFIAM